MEGATIEKLLDVFAIDGELLSLEEHKRGHINVTYIGNWRTPRGMQRFVHQRVNHSVFHDVPGLMRNVDIVTKHIRQKLLAEKGGDETTLEIVPTKNGALFEKDVDGWFWRTFPFVEGTAGFDVCPSPLHAKEAARLLGRFQSHLVDLDPNLLTDTIPQFHYAPSRFKALSEAVDTDPKNRASACRAEISFAEEFTGLGSALIDALAAGKSVARVTHNDMKLNNVLFKADPLQAICLVDLDTCMSGSVLFDFGDLARNTSVTAAEDEPDLSKVQVDTRLFSSIAEGYLSAFGRHLKPGEFDLLPKAPQVLALTLGVRFLTDHLLGDTYFRIHEPGHNLRRARAQFEVVRKFRAVEQELTGTLASLRSRPN